MGEALGDMAALVSSVVGDALKLLAKELGSLGEWVKRITGGKEGKGILESYEENRAKISEYWGVMDRAGLGFWEKMDVAVSPMFGDKERVLKAYGPQLADQMVEDKMGEGAESLQLRKMNNAFNGAIGTFIEWSVSSGNNYAMQKALGGEKGITPASKDAANALTAFALATEESTKMLDQLVNTNRDEFGQVVQGEQGEFGLAIRDGIAELEKKREAEAAKPKKPAVHQDFRHSRFDIKNQFPQGMDPDRVAVAFASDLSALGEKRLSSSILGAY
jgi:hypothetical protein